MPLGDVWLDSKLHLAWEYLKSNKYMVIPDSWEYAIKIFDEELSQRVFWLQPAFPVFTSSFEYRSI